MVFAVALAAAPMLIVRFSPLGQVLDDWWGETTLPGSGAEEVKAEDVEPLPGRPPQGTPGREVRDQGKIIGNPAWVVPPRPRFPDLAMEKGIEAGRVELQCPVSADGTIASCWIMSETPAGAGFGQAAVTGAAHARLRPRTVDGVAVPGMVRFAVNFRL